MRRLPQHNVKPISRGATAWLSDSESVTSTSVNPMIERMLTGFEVLGYTVLLQSDIVSGRHQAVLQSYCHGILGDRFRLAMQRINPTASPQQIESMLRQLAAPRILPLLQHNHQWHLQVLNGVQPDSSETEHYSPLTLQLVDGSNLLNNDWLVIHSFPVIEAESQYCLDLVVFVNGLPLAVFHGLHAGDEAWSLRSAYLQLQRYKTHLPQFFSFNELLVLSNGVQARIGTLTTPWKRFIPIHSVNGEDAPFAGGTELEILIQGVFDKRRLLEVIHHFIVFCQSKTTLTKRLRPQTFCTIPLPRSRR